MNKDVLWRDGCEPNKAVKPPDRCFLGGVTYISVDRVLEIISDMQTDIQSQLTITVQSKANIEWACLEEAKEKIKTLRGGKE